MLLILHMGSSGSFIRKINGRMSDEETEDIGLRKTRKAKYVLYHLDLISILLRQTLVRNQIEL